MKKLLRETLLENNPLFFACGGVAAALIATSNIKTALVFALSVTVALALASSAAAFSSLITGRLGVWIIYIAVASGVMAACSSVMSRFVIESSDLLAKALVLASVGGVTLSCVPKAGERPAHSVVRASLTALMYGALVILLALLRSAVSLASPFFGSGAAALIVIGFIVAGVNFLFVSISERRERTCTAVTDDGKSDGEEADHD